MDNKSTGLIFVVISLAILGFIFLGPYEFTYRIAFLNHDQLVTEMHAQGWKIWSSDKNGYTFYRKRE